MLTDRDEMSNLYRGPSIDISYQVLVHLATSSFRGEFFLEIDQSETRIACGGHVYKGYWGEMCNLYRGSTIDASYQVSVHFKWPSGFRGEDFLEIYQSETRIACDRHAS